MKKVISIFIIIILLIITGCHNKKVNQYNYTYKGENEFWTAEYNINNNGAIYEIVFTATYKKDISQLSSVKKLEISYNSSIANGTLVERYDNGDKPRKVYTSEATTPVNESDGIDEVITATINIDGEIQILELKNQQ